MSVLMTMEIVSIFVLILMEATVALVTMDTV